MTAYCAKEAASESSTTPDDWPDGWVDPSEEDYIPPPGYDPAPDFGVFYVEGKSYTDTFSELRDTVNATEVIDMHDAVAVDPEADYLYADPTDWPDKDTYFYEGGDRLDTYVDVNGCTVTVSEEKIFDDLSGYPETGDERCTCEPETQASYGEAVKDASGSIVTPGDIITDGGILTVVENYDDGASIDEDVFWVGARCKINAAWSEHASNDVQITTNLYFRWREADDTESYSDWKLVHGRVDDITASVNQSYYVYVKMFFRTPEEWDTRTLQFMWLVDVLGIGNGSATIASPNTGVVQLIDPSGGDYITDGYNRCCRAGFYIDDPAGIETSLAITLNPSLNEASIFYTTALPDTWEDVLSGTLVTEISSTGAEQTYTFDLDAIHEAAGTGPIYIWVVMKKDKDDDVTEQTLKDYCPDLTLVIDGTEIDFDDYITEDITIALTDTNGSTKSVLVNAS